MLITLPRGLMIDPGGYSGDMNEMLNFGLDAPGLGGLGQDDLSDLPLTTDTSDTLATLQIGAATTPSATDLSSGFSYSPVTTAPPDLSQYVTNASVAPTSTSSSGNSTAQILTAAGIAAAAAAKGITAASGPYVVPGTSLVYNPATGQIMNGGTLVGTAALPSAGLASIGTYLPLLLGVAAIVLIASSLGGKK